MFQLLLFLSEKLHLAVYRIVNKTWPHLAIAARKGRQFLAKSIPPCGACRQVISGFEDRSGQPIRILLYGTEGVLVSEGISPLLPLRFADEDLR